MKTRQQYKIMVKHFADMYYVKGSTMVHIDITPEDLYLMSENYVFRNKDFSVVIPEATADGEMKDVYYGRFMILRNDGDRQIDMDESNRIQEFLENGVVVHFVANKEGVTLATVFGVDSFVYKRTLRSASQFRTAKLLATEEALVGAVRTHASYGWIDRLEGKAFKTVAKVEPYIGLSLSSSVSAGTGYTDINISDYVSAIDITGALALDDSTGENKIIRYDEYLMEKKGLDKAVDLAELTDGQAIISPQAMAKACCEAGVIYKSEFKSLRLAFKQGLSLAEQLTYTHSLAPIWAKIPAGIQYRYGMKKGFAYLQDHNYVNIQGRQFDFVFPDGANKGEVKRYETRYITDMEAFMAEAKKKGYNVVSNSQNIVIIDHGDGATNDEVELCICNVSSTKEKHWGMLNYQFIQSLGFNFTNDIQVLATKAVQILIKALKTPEDAMAFIGMIDSGDEEKYEERNLNQKLRELLDANPVIFKTRWVQNKIKQLMTKSLEDMRRGRIPVEDSRFVYIVTDPATLLKDGAPLLKKGECYYNGQVGERAIFRSPLIHKSESVVINLVNRPELEEAFGHMKNILILNAFDDTLPRMGGADTDGDKVYLTSEPIIIEAVERNLPMIYGDMDLRRMEPFIWTNGAVNEIMNYDKNTLAPSEIGRITNYCSAHTDKALDIETAVKHSIEIWKMVTLGRLQQGRIIDDAKRGTTTSIDENLKVQEYPEWLESGKIRVPTKSPMGRLYRWVTEVVMPAFKDLELVKEDYRANILIHFPDYDPESVDVVLPQIKALEASYRQDVSAYFTKYDELRTELTMNGVEPTSDEAQDLEAQASEDFKQLIANHQDLLKTIDAPSAIVGMASIHVSENLQRSSSTKVASYPYVVAYEYVESMLSKLPGNFKLVRVNKPDGGLWTTSVAVNENIVYNNEGVVVGAVKNVTDGAYDTHAFKESYFLKVDRNIVKEDIQRTEEKQVQFEISGFRRMLGNDTTPEMVISMIENKTIRIEHIVNEKGNWLGVMFNGKQIGAIGNNTFTNGIPLQGKELEVIRLQPIKGLVKVTAIVKANTEAQTTETQVITTEVVIPQQSTIVLGYDQMDLFDSNIGM